ncbi:hypothetical protein J1N35_023684 [Gossypium stocksii]|uniref:Uncharacterized protein n=1 Tax=Gossypium stocksii TaxID=47602 RepID=A0A9D3VJ03_9ROSI|nr:hypothetical protein J1N35_023684 [Gossypium stocksii]
MEAVRLKCNFENGIDVGAMGSKGGLSLGWKGNSLKGGRLRSERQMHAFRSILENCNLHDLGFVGRWFTWERGKFSDTNIREHLDRGMATLD